MNSSHAMVSAAELKNDDRSLINHYCSTAVAVLMMWHYLTSLDREVELFWKRRFNGACALFFANRYLPIAVVIYKSSWWHPVNTHSGCLAEIVWQFLLQYGEYVIWALFSALRVYALRKARVLAIVVLVLSISPVVANALPVLFLHVNADPVKGCQIHLDVPSLLTKMLFLVSRTSLVIADAIVVVVTWMATYRQRRNLAILGKVKSLPGVLFRDGSIYFVTLTILNVLHLMFSIFSTGLADVVGDHSSILGRFIEPINAIMVTQFFFDLQEAVRGGGSSVLSEASRTLDTVSFARADIDGTARRHARARPIMIPLSSMGGSPSKELGVDSEIETMSPTVRDEASWREARSPV